MRKQCHLLFSAAINIFPFKVAYIRNMHIRHMAHCEKRITAAESIADKRCLEPVLLLMEQNTRFMILLEQRLWFASGRMGDNIFQSCFTLYDRQRAATKRQEMFCRIIDIGKKHVCVRKYVYVYVRCATGWNDKNEVADNAVFFFFRIYRCDSVFTDDEVISCKRAGFLPWMQKTSTNWIPIARARRKMDLISSFLHSTSGL